MDFLFAFAILSFFLGAFITICIYKLLELMFPKVLFKISPESTPKDGGRFNFYLHKWKMPIGWILLMCLFCYVTDLVTQFLHPSYFVFWKVSLIFFIALIPVYSIFYIVIYFSDLLYDYGLNSFTEKCIDGTNYNNKYFAFFWILLVITFISGIVLPAFSIGLPYSGYFARTALIIFFLFFGLLFLKVTVEQNRKERIKEYEEWIKQQGDTEK